MKIGLFSVGAGRAAQPEVLVRLAQKAEEVGFESIFAPEHTVLFASDAYHSPYPYSADGKITGMRADSNLLDPFLALAWAAAHTTHIRIGTGICLVPQRNPLITAKEVASLDILSGGRFIFGVGIGWLKEEFQALGVPPERRAARTREYVEAMKLLWTEASPQFHGEFCEFQPVGSYPKPVQKPYPPILFGGESEPALRRSVEVGDGWLGFDVSPAEAGQAIDRMRQIAAEVGRDFASLDISVSPYSKLPRVDLDSLKQYRDVGVQRVVLINTTTRLEQIDVALEEIGNTLVQPAQSL
ncbi:MAG: LLM class F420-dependent oxidoreductase [Candidatus Tectomicrobia bacterium]